MANIALEINDISKSFFGVYVITDISFKLEKGNILGLIGENGAGKSTLVNIVGGIHQVDKGNMKLFGKLYAPKTPRDALEKHISFVHQELNLFPNLSIADNIFIEKYPGGSVIKHSEMKKRTSEMLKWVDLDISPSTLIEKLSPGQRQLVEIVKCMRINPDIIIFDEPTTSLASKETERLFKLIKKLKSEGKTIIYISHILTDIKKITDDLVVLMDGKITDSGKTDDFSINRMIKSMLGRDIMGRKYPDKINKSDEEVVLKVENLSEPGIIRNINFELHKGEILGLFGLMGSGRTELTRVLFGIDPYKEGNIYIHGKKENKLSPEKSIKNKIGFVTENRNEEGLLLEGNVAENISLVSLPNYSSKILKFINTNKQKESINEIIERLKIKIGSTEKQLVRSLSGGNQQKIVIAKWLMNKPSIFFIDEPTRGIDVGVKYELYCILNKLADSGASILVVSSEIEELVGICDRILIMSKGEISSEFKNREFDNEMILTAAFKQKSML